MSVSFWITGNVRSGKTTRLIAQFQDWLFTQRLSSQSILVFAASADNRVELVNRLTVATQGRFTVNSTTPLGFFEDEVILFWPLLTQILSLRANFPLRLRPENEQDLASRFWQPDLDAGEWQMEGIPRYRLVRRALDLLQLAAFSSTPIEDLPLLLQAAERDDHFLPAPLGDSLVGMLGRWRDWCLQRGFLTYGILTELYGRHLLPHPDYQQHLCRRVQAVLADDVDNYPAIARELFEFLLDRGVKGLFTFNPNGAIRLGLGADPDDLSGLSQRCQVEVLSHEPISILGDAIESKVTELLQTPSLEIPATIHSLQTVARSQLLRRVATEIIRAVEAGEIEPQEIAIIGPGLDAITHYTLIEILTQRGIGVNSLNDQRPLISSALVRALLTLLALVYPGCGRLVEREQVAEMLVILSLQPPPREAHQLSHIDPVRAGLLADHCFAPHPVQPLLLDITEFCRWDRLGYTATTAYTGLRQWLEQQRLDFSVNTQPQSYLTLSPVFILDRAIQRFLLPQNLRSDQLATLRELMETAQHYWAIQTRLHQTESDPADLSTTVSDFIRLLRSGTITANPLPLLPFAQTQKSVTLVTAFQYRSVRPTHRWQFWLDVGGPLWQGGGAVVLWGAPLLLKAGSSQKQKGDHAFPWEIGQPNAAEDEQLRRLILDLCSRATDRVYLCHSDLSVTGQEQVGPLLPLVDASLPFPAHSITNSLEAEVRSS